MLTYLFLILIFLFASPVVSVITELQWYDALGVKDVYTTRLALQTGLFVGSLAVTFGYLFINALIALRVRSGPGLRAVGIRRPILRSARSPWYRTTAQSRPYASSEGLQTSHLCREPIPIPTC